MGPPYIPDMNVIENLNGLVGHFTPQGLGNMTGPILRRRPPARAPSSGPPRR
jgi:hypothetical protein